MLSTLHTLCCQRPTRRGRWTHTEKRGGEQCRFCCWLLQLLKHFLPSLTKNGDSEKERKREKKSKWKARKMLKSICNVACQRPVGRSPGVARSEAGTRREFRGFVPRIKLAATKLITFGYFQLVAAQCSAQGLWVEAGRQGGVAGSCLHARPKRWLNIR